MKKLQKYDIAILFLIAVIVIITGISFGDMLIQ